MALKNKTQVEFEENSNAFYEAAKQARWSAEKYLKWALKKYGEKSVNLKTKATIYKIVLDLEYDDQNINVIYDGGNHPEYASNAFSMVYGVFMENNDIAFNIEDCGCYEIERMDTMDLLAVTDAVMNYISNIDE